MLALEQADDKEAMEVLKATGGKALIEGYACYYHGTWFNLVAIPTLSQRNRAPCSRLEN